MRSVLAFLLLTACAHSHRPPPPAKATSFDIPSMGTIWHFEVTALPAERLPQIKDQLQQILARYEKTFSDWIEDSELRLLEKKGLTEPLKPSELFMKGLRWSEEGCRRSKGSFDITIGAVQWKALAKPVGCEQLVLKDNSFYFKVDPKRLTLDGIVKGAAVTAAARYLRQALPESQEIVNAGGGNIFLSGTYAAHEGLKAVDHTISHSFSLQGNRQHIFDPQHVDRFLNAGASALCELPADPESWERLGAMADVLSKTAILRPDIDFGLPSCKIYKHR